jgi:hypothetical protein
MRAGLLMKFRAKLPTASLASRSNFRPAQTCLGLSGGDAERQGGYMMALVVGLVSIAAVWLIVIYGSIYLNKNVQ